jgi:enterobactin synthetase component D
MRPDGGPDWPIGFVGSISHCHDIAVAAAERSSRLRSIGIDVERIADEGRATRLRHVVMTPDEERRSFGSHALLTVRQRFTLVFSAKESALKCSRPVVPHERSIELGDFEMGEVDAHRGTFALRIVTELGAEFSPGYELFGRFAWFEEHVLTVVELEGPPPRPSACHSS